MVPEVSFHGWMHLQLGILREDRISQQQEHGLSHFLVARKQIE